MISPNKSRVSQHRTEESLEWELQRLCKKTEEALQECWKEAEELKEKNKASVQEAAELEDKISLMRRVLELNLRTNEVTNLSSGRSSDQEIRKRPAHDFFGILHTIFASHKMDDHIVHSSSFTYQRSNPKSMKRLHFSVCDHALSRQEKDLKMQLKAMEMDMEETRRELQSDIDKRCLACDTLKRTALLQDETITVLRSEVLRLKSSRVPKTTVIRTQVSLLTEKVNERECQIQALLSTFKELTEVGLKDMKAERLSQGDDRMQYTEANLSFSSCHQSISVGR
eukprot:CAMPEP_0195517306 /NCGR_PEP_ID=MMETSP0794_2-20130614/10291_1 /TAXON_ID=515487 /ORGANISM="Stephanopyxis turris, Strain CCMP 815" /LENGTH=282 /DNA_ID=CAMNT_0040646081 /DNA_START=23 /DNA_END=871 /DNA_ORIENTATION=-